MARKKFQWSRDEDNPEGEFHFTERRSWSDRDQENKKVVGLAKALVRLRPSAYGEVELSADVRQAVGEARRLRAKGNVKGGMRRQMLKVATVLREQDEEVLQRLFEDVDALT
jgi:ribosomal 50S subunit-associated protein YjgA (DUF615 family)